MRYPQLLIYESDGKLARIFHDLARERKWSEHARERMWSLHEPRRPDTCLELLRRGGPSVLVLQLGSQLEAWELLERINADFPDTATLVIPEMDHPALAVLAWDLGAHGVIAANEARDRLPDWVAAALGVSLRAEPLPHAEG